MRKAKLENLWYAHDTLINRINVMYKKISGDEKPDRKPVMIKLIWLYFNIDSSHLLYKEWVYLQNRIAIYNVKLDSYLRWKTKQQAASAPPYIRY